MYKMIKSITVLFALFCLGSCTITKRVHNPGWHVEWKNTFSAEKNQSVQDEMLIGEQAELNERAQVHSEEVQLTEELLSPENAEAQEADNIDVLAKIDDAKSSESVGHKGVSKRNNTSERHGKTHFASEKMRSESHTLPLPQNLKVSLISSIAVILCVFLMSISTSVLALFCSLALIFSILTIVFAVIGIREVKRAPETWKGRKLAVLLIVIGILEFCFSLLVSLLLLSYFGFL